jgi:MarR family transcriptional regulator, lower aerobic nicotinate degradation pathway regulator
MVSQASLPRRARAERARAPEERPQGGDDTRQVLNSLRHIVRALRVSSRDAEQRVGISGAQLFVLQCLQRQSPCSVNELAVATATDQSSVSVVVSRLVRAGYVKRVASALDRRRAELTITVSGRRLLAAAPEAAQERLLTALGKLQQRELAQLARLLGKVVDHAVLAPASPSLFFEDTPALVVSKRSGDHGRR